MVLRHDPQWLQNGDPQVQAWAARLANQQMRLDVLPLLSQRHPRPNSWNPLRSDVTGDAPYGMKLWLPDKLVMEILKSEQLMKMTATIVHEAVFAAAMAHPKQFLTNILEEAILGGSKNNRRT